MNRAFGMISNILVDSKMLFVVTCGIFVEDGSMEYPKLFMFD